MLDFICSLGVEIGSEGGRLASVCFGVLFVGSEGAARTSGAIWKIACFSYEPRAAGRAVSMHNSKSLFINISFTFISSWIQVLYTPHVCLICCTLLHCSLRASSGAMDERFELSSSSSSAPLLLTRWFLN